MDNIHIAEYGTFPSAYQAFEWDRQRLWLERSPIDTTPVVRINGDNCKQFGKRPAEPQPHGLPAGTARRETLDYCEQGLSDEMRSLIAEQAADDSDVLYPENHLFRQTADHGDDTGQYERFAETGGQPIPPTSTATHRCWEVGRLAQRTTLSPGARETQRLDRARFGIEQIIAKAYAPKRRGRPSKAEMMERAKAGI